MQARWGRSSVAPRRRTMRVCPKVRTHSRCRATDTSGNTDATQASRTWTVDGPPETTIGSGPSDGSYVRSTSASFSFSSSEAGSTFHCSRDGFAFAACTSPKSYSSLSQGSHTFRVKAIDKAGKHRRQPCKPQLVRGHRGPKGHRVHQRWCGLHVQPVCNAQPLGKRPLPGLRGGFRALQEREHNFMVRVVRLLEHCAVAAEQRERAPRRSTRSSRTARATSRTAYDKIKFSP